MHVSTPLLLSALLSVAAASPTKTYPITKRQSNTTIAYNTTFITYIANYDCSPGPAVFPGTVTSDVCLRFRATSYRVAALPTVNCTFTTYAQLGCLEENKDTVYALPAGNGTVCAYGGVPDGGLHYWRSGMYTCP